MRALLIATLATLAAAGVVVARRGPDRFVHAKHPKSTECLSCHGESGGKWMSVKRAEPAGCLSCHGVRADHLAQPDSMCAFCHAPLAGASERVTTIALAGY